MEESKKGYTGVPNQIIDCEDLSAHAKLVYVYLLRLNPCFPSYPVIGKKCGLSRSSAYRSIKELITYGAIVKDDRKGRSNSYKIRLYDTHLRASKGLKTSVTQTRVKTAPVSHRHGGSVTQTLVPVSHRHPNKKKEQKKLNKSDSGVFGNFSDVVKRNVNRIRDEHNPAEG